MSVEVQNLQPVVKQTPSYIKDTDHFTGKVYNFYVPVNSILDAMDVKSLYTSITSNEGIAAATKKRCENCIHKTLPTKIIATFLLLILTPNNFVFSSNIYLQIKGCLCKYFHGWIWTKIYLSVDKRQISFFLRYIDDIFMVWTKSETQLEDFMNMLNEKYPSIKFDYKFDWKQIEFLDPLVCIDQ